MLKFCYFVDKKSTQQICYFLPVLPANLFAADISNCKWKKMDDMKVMFVFIRVMLADESYVPVNESYHYKMAFGLCAWKQT